MKNVIKGEQQQHCVGSRAKHADLCVILQNYYWNRADKKLKEVLTLPAVFHLFVAVLLSLIAR